MLCGTLQSILFNLRSIFVVLCTFVNVEEVSSLHLKYDREIKFSPDGVVKPETVDQHLGSSSENVVQHPFLASSIDRTVDPCNDFYKFVCNGFVRQNPIPNNEQRVTQMKIIENKISAQLKEILENPPTSLKREENLMYIYYSKCIENLFGKSNEGLIQLNERIRRLRREAFFLTDWLLIMNPVTVLYEIRILPDEYNSTVNMINIIPTTPMQPFSTYFDPAYSSQFVATRTILYDFLSLLSTNEPLNHTLTLSESQKWRRIDSLFKVDQNMAKIQQEAEFSSSSLTVGIRGLMTTIPSIHWVRYLSTILPMDIVQKNPKLAMNIKQAKVISKYESLFFKLDKQVLSDYLDWKVFFYFAPFLGPEYSQILDKYNTIVYGTQPKNKTRDCLERTNSYFSDILGSFWIKKYFNEESVPQVTALVTNIRDSFLKLLNSNEWMDEETKTKAREKAHAIIPFIGFDPKQYSSEAIAENFAQLNFSSTSSYYQISLLLDKWSAEQSFLKLNEYNSRNTFETKVTDANAFYDPNQNQIAILAGILQEPYFNASWPNLLNEAAIGMVAGHEITHGFDDYGAMFDEKGNRVNWWDETTFEKFEKKKACIEKQYSNVTVVDSLKLNGLRTEGENIADNGGMRAAIRSAFDNQNERKVVVKDLEDFSSHQLYFMTYAFTWCGNSRPETIRTDLAVEEHSPAFVRVNLVLSNQPEFAEAFKCTTGTPMNPKEKCTVW